MSALVQRVRKCLQPKRELTKQKQMALNLHSYLEQMGWYKSVETSLPVDSHGDPLPWYTYSAISFLTDRIHTDMAVFEYGSGNSTHWWSRRVAKVVACEHEFDWYITLKDQLPPNVSYQHYGLKTGGSYSRYISEFLDEFDIVIIDGRDRVNCAKNSLSALRKNGLIIWDNSDRDRYQEGYDFLHGNNFKRLDFWGLGPINSYQWSTSIFYRRDNCLGI